MKKFSRHLAISFPLSVVLLGLLVSYQNCARPTSGPNSSGSVDISSTANCSACHGGQENSAPPAGTHGETDTASMAVGAHQAHVRSTDLHRGYDCTECHIKPNSILDSGHFHDGPARIVFGETARTGGAQPQWNHETGTCSGTYCHGSSSPIWTKVDGAQKSCSSCHGFPPPSPHPQRTNCLGCHAAFADVANHVNGHVDQALSCNSCHGGAENYAPPQDTKGLTDVSLVSVGAHQSHMKTSLTQPISCSECHVVPTSVDDPGHIMGQRARVVLGNRSSQGGVNPNYDMTQVTCATYCHNSGIKSKFGGIIHPPVWNKMDGTQGTCASCHGQITNDNTVDMKHSGQNCGTCHQAYPNGGVSASQHLDGITDKASARGTCRSCHANVNVTRVLHPAGIPGSPLQNVATNPSESCVICHMPKGLHLFRANTSYIFQSFPNGVAPGDGLANTAPDGTFQKAAWLDVDLVCGQCHGGGTSATTNPPSNGASWKSKLDLAHNAVTFHSGAYPSMTQVGFGYTYDGLNTLKINTSVGQNICATKTGDTAPCERFEWDWGDGSPRDTGPSSSHTYAVAGNYKVTLYGEIVGVSGGSGSTFLNVYKPDYPPINNSTCNFDNNSWTLTITDASTDDNAITQEVVTWGDGGLVTNDIVPPFGPFVHTYTYPGTFNVTHKVYDSRGQSASKSCVVTSTYFSLAGVVRKSDGVTGVPSATVTLISGSSTRTAYTGSDGTFSVINLKPGTWTVYVSKTGYTFNSVQIQIGPSLSDFSINASSP